MNRKIGQTITSKFRTPKRLSQLSRNSLFSVAQSLAVAACLFLSYRIVLAHASLDELGVWSLLMAGTAIARISDFSGAGALSRFVAMKNQVSNPMGAPDTIHTVLLTSLLFNTVLGLLIWIVAPFVISKTLDLDHIGTAKELMPFVIISMVLGALAVGVTSSIDGVHRADQRAVLVASSALAMLLSCFLLIPKFGVIGFGISQLIQQMILIIVGWLVLRGHVRNLGWIPYRWRWGVFQNTTGYALKLNGIAILNMMFDPVAKFAFNYSSGPAFVAIYELASRVVTQARAPVIAAVIPLIPEFATLGKSGEARLKSLLHDTTNRIATASIAISCINMIAAPIVSLIILNEVSGILLLLIAALTLGWNINLFCVAYYIAAQAQGRLLWNFANHAVNAGGVFLALLLLVPSFGEAGLVFGIVLGLIVGSMVNMLGNSHMLNATTIVKETFPHMVSASSLILLICSLGSVWALLLF